MQYPPPPQGDIDADDALGRRIAAGFLDVVLLGGAFVLIGVTMGRTTTGQGSFNVELGGGGTLLFVAVVFFYYFLTEAGLGRSPGKAMLGLKVAAEDGTKPTPGAIALRTLLRFVDWLPLLYLVGLVAVVVTGKKRQRLGDMAAKTRVIRAS